MDRFAYTGKDMKYLDNEIINMLRNKKENHSFVTKNKFHHEYKEYYNTHKEYINKLTKEIHEEIITSEIFIKEFKDVCYNDLGNVCESPRRKTIEKIYKQLLIRYLFIDEVDYENIVLSKITIKDLDSICFDNVYLWIPDILEQIRDLYVKEGVMREKSDEEFESEYADELKAIKESLEYDNMSDDYIDRYEPGDDFEEDWIRSLE